MKLGKYIIGKNLNLILVRNFTLKVFSVLFNTLIFFTVAKFLGASDSGVFFLLISFVSVISVLSRLGFDLPVVRVCSIENDVKLDATILSSFTIVFIFSVILTTLVLISSKYISIYIFDSKLSESSIRIISPSIIFLSSIIFIGYVFVGKRKFLLGQAFHGLALNFFLLIFVLICLSIDRFRIDNILIGYTVCSGFIFIVSVVYLFKNVRKKVLTKDLYLFKEAVRFYWITRVLNLSRDHFPVILLGMFSSSAELSIFNLSIKAMIVISFLSEVLNNYYSSKIAKHYHENNLLSFSIEASKLLSILYIITFPILMIILLFSGFFGYYLDEDFSGVGECIYLLASFSFITLSLPSLRVILSMIGENHSVRTSSIIQVFTLLILGVLLIPQFGYLGAAISFSLSILFAFIYCFYKLNKSNQHIFKNKVWR